MKKSKTHRYTLQMETFFPQLDRSAMFDPVCKGPGVPFCTGRRVRVLEERKGKMLCEMEHRNGTLWYAWIERQHLGDADPIAVQSSLL